MAHINLASHIWIIMPVAIIVIGIGIISASVFLAQHAENLLESDSSNSKKMLIEHLKERASHLYEVNHSIQNVAGIVGSAIATKYPSSFAIQTHVSPVLFMAFNTIRLASQISYVKVNGVVFSYLRERNQIRAIFSNISSKSFNSTLQHWYTQKVNNLTGKGYGGELVTPPIRPNDSLWFSDALKGHSYGISRKEFCIFATKDEGSCISSKLFRGSQRDKLYALANLIKAKEATQQAERKSMNKSLAFASACHDVRASLAGITGLISLCRVDVPSNSDVARNLTQMDSCASKLLGILNSVLDTSKVEAGKMQLENVEFNMAQAIEESVDIFHVVALAKGLEIIWDPCDFSVLMSSNVRGDCRRFKQILDNLLSNAVKFTLEGHVVVRAWVKKVGSNDPEFPSIQQESFSNIWTHLARCAFYIGGAFQNKKPLNSIHHGQRDMEFIFEVDDTGSGIPKDRRASIFENYVQVKESTLGCEGTGLGLGIVQSYVRLMGGDICVKEKLPGERGSCFMFNIFLESHDISSNHDEEDFGSCKIPIFNRLHSFSTKTRAKMQSNIRALASSQGVIVEGIWCLLLMRGGETRRILKEWMKNLGIKVSVAQQPEYMYDELKRMSHNYSASGNYDSSLSSSGVNSEFSSPRVENHVLPLSMKDVPKKASLKDSKYLLVIVDLCFGTCSEMLNFLTCIAKGSQFHQYRVICVTDSTASCSQLPCDLLLHKPLHGSRIYKILGLMQEFRQRNEELKPDFARESISTNELETKNLLKSADPKQNNFVVLNNENEKEPLSGMKVLLVEDTLLLRQIAMKLLSRSGAIVKSVDNGVEALNVVREALKETIHNSEGSSKHLPFDFILMDCQMPVMDGYEATKCIRAEEKTYGIHIPIFALSALAESEEAKKSLVCGMDFHLTKPIVITQLLEAIKFPLK